MDQKKSKDIQPIQQSQFKILLILDNYNDIFSDFDPRPYSEKALSEDFLSEVKRRHVPKKKGGLEVRFMLPDNERDPKIEAMAKRRLKAYFQQESKILRERLEARKRRGYTYVVSGAAILLIVTYLVFQYPDDFWITMAELLLTPFGWFGMWEGFGKVVERDENISQQLELSRMLSKSDFVFISESEATTSQ